MLGIMENENYAEDMADVRRTWKLNSSILPFGVWQSAFLLAQKCVGSPAAETFVKNGESLRDAFAIGILRIS